MNTNTPADTSASLELAALKEIAENAVIIRPVLQELCISISKNLSSTTEPISEELLHIRTSIADFLSSVSKYDDEVRNHTMLSKVTAEGESLKRDLESLDTGIQTIFTQFEQQLAQLKEISKNIRHVTIDINEVSEKIRLLSFNASIEAARAGKAGAGFRIIASEVKNLSNETEQDLKKINETLNEIDTVFQSIHDSFRGNSKTVLGILHNRRSELTEYFGMIDSYFKNFDQLYTSVNEVINDLSRRMTVISPVIQLHEITSQEIGNLGVIADDYNRMILEITGKSESLHAVLKSNEALVPKAKELADKVRSHLTTERELTALKKGIEKTVPNIQLDLAMNTNDIELF